MNEVGQKIRNELETVYITSDGRKFLKYIDALYAQSELERGIEIKLSKQKRIMDIVELIMNVLKSENWGIYYKNQPIQPLEMKDGDPLYKINQVNDKDIERAIETRLTEGESWQQNHSHASLNQKNSSETG